MSFPTAWLRLLLRHEFSYARGLLLPANLRYLQAFDEANPKEEIIQQLAGQIPWWHNIIIITKLKDSKLRKWFIRACIENG